MSSQKTDNLGLHKWVPEDYVQMTEFNENFDKIDALGDATDTLVADVETLTTELESTVKKEVYTQEMSAVTSQLADTMSNVNNLFINVKHPPTPLIPALVDGVTDDTIVTQNILNYVGDLGGGTVFVPRGTLIHSILYIPDNVTLKGSGYQTVLKLIDNCPLVKTVQQTGIYPKQNISFFGIENLTYDGNALGNLTMTELETIPYDNFRTHGIVNFYAKPDGTVGGETPAKDFLINNVHIKNTIRNTLLIGGKTEAVGSVNNLTVENAYADHLIYETNTNTTVSYKNITLKGFWRGAAIIAETGKFENVRIANTFKNPVTGYKLGAMIDIRGQYVSALKSKPHFKNVVADLLFAELDLIIGSQDSSRLSGCSFENLTINQADSFNAYGVVPPALFNSPGNSDVKFNTVELNNIQNVILLYASGGTNGISFDDVKINYASERTQIIYEEALIVLTNATIGDIKNLTVKNVIIPSKAPSLIRLRTSGTRITNVDNVVFENINTSTSLDTINIFNVIDKKDFFKLTRVFARNSRWVGYAAIPSIIRDQIGVELYDCFHNEKTSKTMVFVSAQSGAQVLTAPVKYIISKPRIVNVNPTYPNQIPSYRVSFSDFIMTINFSSPLTAYQEFYIQVDN